MNFDIFSLLIPAAVGAFVGVSATIINNRVTTGKHEQRLDEHDRRFVGVDTRFSTLDSDFVPRLELMARFASVIDSQNRIEKTLNLVLDLRGGKKQC